LECCFRFVMTPITKSSCGLLSVGASVTKCLGTEHRQLRNKQLQPTVLALQRLQPLRLAHVHPAELLLPAIERRTLIPRSRHRSALFTPASLRLGIPTICSSVCRLFFIASSLA